MDDVAKIAAGLTDRQQLELIDAWPSLGQPGVWQVMGNTPMGDLVSGPYGHLTPKGLAVRAYLQETMG